MFPWNLPPTNAMLRQIQRDLEQMKEGFDAAFSVMLGVAPPSLAPTPAEVVYTERAVRLLRYRPSVEHPRAPPLLIVPAVVNRSYLFDLTPDHSMVGYLVRRGIDVYLLDWGTPGAEDRATTFDQYITGYLWRVVQRVRANSGHERVDLLGYSIGGVFSTIFCALFGRSVGNLVLLAAPINFHDDGMLSQWMRKERFNVDLVVDALGSMPAELMRASFRMLQPTIQIARRMTLAKQLDDPQAVRDLLAMQTWIDDCIAFPGEVYRKLIKDCYQENYLARGMLTIDGRRVDLAKIDQPLLTITATNDLICPPASAAALNDIVASTDKQVLELLCGHVEIVAGRRAAEELWPQLADWLIGRSAA